MHSAIYSAICKYFHMCGAIYIYREREKDMLMYCCVHIYITCALFKHIYIYRCNDDVATSGVQCDQNGSIYKLVGTIQGPDGREWDVCMCVCLNV